MDQRVVVASKNPVKLWAVRVGFERIFPAGCFAFEAIEVDSGVGHQPVSDQETLSGARGRARRAAEACPQADLWVGIEGGIEDGPEGMLAFAWAVVLSADREGRARSGAFLLPQAVARLVREGVELGDADDVVFGRRNSKQEEGAIGLLTGGAVDRRSLYAHTVCLALARFKTPEVYAEPPEAPGVP